MNKLLIVSGEDDKSLWVVMRGAHAILERHKGNISAHLLENAAQAKLDQLTEKDVLYIAGHASPANIHGKTAAVVWDLLSKNGLPKSKLTLKFIACNTGNFPSKKRGTASQPVPATGIFAKELKELVKASGRTGCKLLFPVSYGVVLGAKEGDAALDINQEMSLEEAKKLLNINETADALTVQLCLEKENQPALTAANTAAVQGLYKSKQTVEAVAAATANAAGVKSFFDVYNPTLTKYKLYRMPIDSGWITLTT